MVKKINQNLNILESISVKITHWIGTPYSIVIHSLLFLGIFVLKFFGMSVDYILLILTTAVSLEAIYLSIFIQMTVNRQSESLESVEDDIEEISEDVEDISEDLDQIQATRLNRQPAKQSLESIQLQIQAIYDELTNLRKNGLS